MILLTTAVCCAKGTCLYVSESMRAGESQTRLLEGFGVGGDTVKSSGGLRSEAEGSFLATEGACESEEYDKCS